MKKRKARTKWCPEARPTRTWVGGDSAPVCHNNPGDVKCIASKCMMWVKTRRKHGYCGKAGLF